LTRDEKRLIVEIVVLVGKELQASVNIDDDDDDAGGANGIYENIHENEEERDEERDTEFLLNASEGILDELDDEDINNANLNVI